MTSQKQIEANKNNAILGGVKTENGKNITRFNSLKHGVFRQSISEYEDEFYSEILQDMISELNPIGLLENILIERIATCYLKLFRLAKAEKEHIKASLHPVKDEFDLSWHKPNEDGYLPRINETTMKHLTDIYSRYETTTENRLYRAMHELERLQKIRQGEAVNAPITIDVTKMGSFSETGI